MFQWTPYIFLRWVFFLIVGILLSLFFPYIHQTLLYVGAVAWLAYLLCWFMFTNEQSRRYTIVFGILVALILISVGSLRTAQFTAQSNPLHFMNQDILEAYQGKIVTDVQERSKSFRTQLEVQKVLVKGTWKPATGRIMVYFRKSEGYTLPKNLGYGSLILTNTQPQKLSPSKNPEGFDYQSYLFYQNIYHQHFINETQYKIIGKELSALDNFWALSYTIKEKGLAILKKHLPESTRFATASALLLGVKDYLDDDLRAAYSGSGLMHLLAVSGLHVGLVMWMISWVFAPLKKTLLGKYVFLILVVSLLNIYAFITGLSPSVLRAVLMFTLVLVAITFERKGLIYNNISISAFILLIFNPFLLASVSFQLSYLALLGIVYLQPKIYAWLEVKNYWIDKAWELTSVSIAAQIGTAPLAIYYFHQFPNYFILANLLVLPFAGLVLGLGIVLLLFDFIPYLSDGLGFVFYHLIGAVNGVAYFIQKLPGAVSLGWYLSATETFLLYLFLFFFLLLWAKRKLYYLGLAVLALAIFQASMAVRYFENASQKQLVIFHTPRQAHFNVIMGRESYFLAKNNELLSDSSSFSFNIEPYWLRRGVGKVYKETFQETSFQMPFGYQTQDKWSIFKVENKLFLLLHQRLYESDYASISTLKPDYVVIQNNALGELSAISEVIKIPYLVIDASNGRFLAQRIEEEAKDRKLPCWNIGEKGAFRMDL